MTSFYLSGRHHGLALVDAEDHEAVTARAWYLHPGGYAYRTSRVGGRSYRLYLHRWLLGLERGDKRQVDHVNGNKLDNRRENLRLATPSQNSQNMARAPGPSGHRNVYWHRSGNWRVQVCVAGKRVSGGYFKELDEAVVAAGVLRQRLMPFANTARDLPTETAGLQVNHGV